ncbi:hypothetical protein JCM10450v2_000585 [Rhodotorula kratochvilovae]
MTSVTVAPATPADLAALARIHHDAFSPSTINQLVWGNVHEDDSIAALARFLEKELKKPTSFIFKADVDGEIKGLALWTLRAGEINATKDEDEPDFAPETNEELAKEFFGMLDKVKETYDERFYHLAILAIDPSSQGLGIGRKLLQWGCDEADAAGLPVFLEASDEGIPLYEKTGFAQFGERVHSGPDGQMTVLPMRRLPQQVQGA